MQFYIYKIVNKKTGHFYYGKATCPNMVNPQKHYYFGSGTYLKKNIAEHGIENFEKVIVEMCESEEESYNREKYYIDKYFNDPLCLNKKQGGCGDKIGTKHKTKKEALKWSKIE